MPNIHDVAKAAGVSAGTVSNVLNRPSYVNRETRERVLQAIEELGFYPARRKRQFRPGRVKTLGVALANLGNPFFVDVALGAEEAATEHKSGVVFCNSSYDAVREAQNLDMLVQQRVQGIIIAPVDEDSPRLEALVDRGVPMVFVDRVADGRDYWSVTVDDFRGGQLSCQHLIDLGHRRLAFVGHPEKSPKVRQRLDGATDAAGKASATVKLEVISVKSWTIEAGQRAGQALAARPPAARPTAVICANDMVALGLMQQVLRAGLSVPGDLSIVGYDDLEWAAAATIPLTTVRQPRRLLGRTAVQLLLQRLDGIPGEAPSANRIVLLPDLLVRESTGPRTARPGLPQGTGPNAE